MAFSKFCVMTIAIASLASCSASQVAAETILANGRIYTLDPKAPWVEAMVIRDSEIVFAGTTIDAKAHGTRGATTIDLKRHVVLPGLHDVHMHPLEANNPAAGTCLFDAPLSLKRIKQIMADCRDRQQGTAWITGWGFSLADLSV
jgi:predicted amidohydrolase YtcJ